MVTVYIVSAIVSLYPHLLVILVVTVYIVLAIVSL